MSHDSGASLRIRGTATSLPLQQQGASGISPAGSASAQHSSGGGSAIAPLSTFAPLTSSNVASLSAASPVSGGGHAATSLGTGTGLQGGGNGGGGGADSLASSDPNGDSMGVFSTHGMMVIEPLEWRDSYRNFFGNLPCAFFHTVSLLVTSFLLAVALMDRALLHSAWYSLLEGLMVLFFAFELASRWVLARSGGFFQNRTNLAECILCGVCIVTFFTLIFARSSTSRQQRALEAKEPQHDASASSARQAVEHEIVVVLRFTAQLFRACMYLRNVLRVRREGAHTGIAVNMHAVPVAVGIGAGMSGGTRV